MLTAEKLINYLIEEMGLTDIDSNTLLFSSTLLDSFSMVDLIAFIERESEIKIAPTEVTLDNLDSVNRILAFVERRHTSA